MRYLDKCCPESLPTEVKYAVRRIARARLLSSNPKEILYYIHVYHSNDNKSVY